MKKFFRRCMKLGAVQLFEVALLQKNNREAPQSTVYFLSTIREDKPKGAITLTFPLSSAFTLIRVNLP